VGAEEEGSEEEGSPGPVAAGRKAGLLWAVIRISGAGCAATASEVIGFGEAEGAEETFFGFRFELFGEGLKSPSTVEAEGFRLAYGGNSAR
jgi:hypothetical protein